MLIFDEHEQTIILDNIYTPTPVDYMWVLDLAIMDFTLTPLLVLEEIVCPSINLRIRGFDFWLPSNWNILIFSEETLQLDVIEISELAGREFTAFVYDVANSNKINYHPGICTVLDYAPERSHTGPQLNKHQMLCHPIGPKEWINITPSDTYNKYLKELVIGNIL